MYPGKSATHHNWTVIGMVAAGALALLALLILALRLGTGVMTSSEPAGARDNGAAAVAANPQAVAAPKTGAEAAAPAVVAPSVNAPKRIDLGGGYTLETDQMGGQIVAPETVLKPQVASSPSTIPVTGAASIASGAMTLELENGYTLMINEDGRHLLLSPSAAKGRIAQALSNPSTIPVTGAAPSKTLDLGAGYTLTLNENGGQIIPPATLLKTGPAASSSVTMTTDLGNGYTLVEDENGKHMILSPAAMQEHTSQLNNGSVPVTGAPSSTVRTYIGGGFWLETGPDGKTVITK